MRFSKFNQPLATHDNMSFSSFPCLPFIQHNIHSIKQISAQNNWTHYLQGVKQVFESTQTFQFKDKTAISQYFPKTCPELCLPEA